MLTDEEALINESTCLLSITSQEDKPDILRRTRLWLYTSHLFAQFSDNLWQFCLVLFLAAFSNYESLMLVSTYGLMTGLSVCLFGSTAGRFVDSQNRLYAARVFIFSENACVLLATILCYALLARDTEQLIAEQTESITDNIVVGSGIRDWIRSRFYGVPSDPLSVFLLVGIHLLGATAQILSKGFVVAIERDWIVVMSGLASLTYGQRGPDASEKAWLSETNVTMKQIDLACKVGAPAIAGFVIAAFDNGMKDHGSGMRGAAILVGVINCVSLMVEYICTLNIYNLIPEMGVKAHEIAISRDAVSSEIVAIDSKGYEAMGKCGFFQLPRGLRIYLSQPISFGGLGYALLYLNALSFGGIMTAYLVWRGMRFDSVGVWRGISCAIGLLGTFVYHWSVKIMSVESTGMWSIMFQFLCLSLSYASLFVKDLYTSLAMLIAGVCASRIGLWVFDIAVTQLMQDCVPAHIRGVTGGVQQSLNAFFGLLAFVLGIIFPDPNEFHIYVSAGYASVGIAMLMYAFGVYMRQDKLRVS
jgi:solute carrier family 40 (iron-regulated transporter), member 1